MATPITPIPVTISWNDVEKKWKADPPKVEEVKRGVTICWQAQGSAVTLLFPDDTIFGLSHVKIDKDDSITLEVKRNLKNADEYGKEKNFYAAYCHTSYESNGNKFTGCFAEGESSPIIIIER